MASGGYPGAYETGKEITGTELAEAGGVTVFHAGTQHLHGRFETAGGRVLGVTASGADLGTAIGAAYEGVSQIRFEGNPIGYWRTGLAPSSRVSWSPPRRRARGAEWR